MLYLPLSFTNYRCETKFETAGFPMKYKTDQLFICKTKGDIMTAIIELVYNFLWGDLVTLPLPGGGTLGLPLLVILLIPTGIYFTIRTKFLPIRLFPDMVRALNEKKDKRGGLSSFQTLIVSTATRVGMGNLVGVVAAISAGAPVRYSGCGSPHCLVPPLLLLKVRWRSFIKKKIRFTVVSTAALLIICIIFLPKEKTALIANTPYLLYFLQFPVLSAGAESVR